MTSPVCSRGWPRPRMRAPDTPAASVACLPMGRVGHRRVVWMNGRACVVHSDRNGPEPPDLVLYNRDRAALLQLTACVYYWRTPARKCSPGSGQASTLTTMARIPGLIVCLLVAGVGESGGHT
jgi:hypothetical protein